MKCESLGVDYGTSIKTEDTCTFFHETGETIIFIHPKVAAPVYHVHGYNSQTESQSVYQSFIIKILALFQQLWNLKFLKNQLIHIL